MNEIQNGSLIARLWRGNVSLFKTYWGFGVLGGILLNIAYFLFVENNYMRIASLRYGEYIFYAISILAVLYSIFILIAIWRSAGKYTGRRLWSILARIAVILGFIQVAGAIAKTVNTLNVDTIAGIREQLATANRSLPIMVDEITRLDRLDLVGRKITYSYTLLGKSRSDFNLEEFSASINSSIRAGQCEDDTTKQFLNEVDQVSYVYRDKDGMPLARVDITKADCAF